MRRALHIGVLLLGLLALARPAPAAQVRSGAQASAQRGGVEVTARLSTGVVKLGAQVQLIVQVDGAQDARIGELPTVDGLVFGPVGKPSSQSRMVFAGGKRSVSYSLTWGIPIQPQRTGQYTIPPIEIESGGERHPTRELLLKVVEDLKGEELGRFEFRHPERVYEGEPFTLELVFGWDAAIDGSINFANLSLPWLGELSGVLEVGAQDAGFTPSVEVNLNSTGRIAVEELGKQTVDGRPFRCLRLRKRCIATRPSDLEFPTSHLEFGRVVREGFFGESRAETQYFKRFPAFSIEVLEIPEEGRPFDYTGAVGKIEASADADRREVDAGESIKLTVEWSGEANLEFFDPPDPARSDAFAGFRVYGTTDTKSPERRVVVYDLAPISPEVREIPPVSLSLFDTQEGRYTTVATRSIPIRVRALAKGQELAAEGERREVSIDIRDIQPLAAVGGSRARPGRAAVASSILGVPLLWLGLRTLVRRRGDPASIEVRRRRRARRQLARDLDQARTAGEEARALYRFLAARTAESAEAWLGRDVRERVLSPEAASALDGLIRKLDERTWAGDDAPLARDEVLAVADQLIAARLGEEVSR